MNIWLVSVYGSIPSDGWRGYRPNLIGEALSEMGHQVTWWAANFSHQHKSYRCQGWGRVDVNPGFQIRLVPTSRYKRNISLARLWFELLFAWRLYFRARKEERGPDAVLATEPPQSNACVAGLLARHFRAPLVLDFNDLWPELFAIAFPAWARWLASAVLFPFYGLRRLNFRAAQGIVAVSKSYLELAKREAPALGSDRFVTAYTGCDIGKARLSLLTQEQLGDLSRRMNKPPDEVWAIYAGGLGDNYDIQTLLSASRLLAQWPCKVRIIIAGAGPGHDAVLRFVQEHPTSMLRFLGKLTPEELTKVYQLCGMAICAYAPGSTVTMPTKIFDYLAAGLPIVNSLGGELEQLLEGHNLGLHYAAGDPASLASTLAGLASDPEARASMSRNCLEVAPQFDSHLQYARIGRLFEAVVGGARPRAPIGDLQEAPR